jgi:hypothetical protein
MARFSLTGRAARSHRRRHVPLSSHCALPSSLRPPPPQQRLSSPLCPHAPIQRTEQLDLVCRHRRRRLGWSDRAVARAAMSTQPEAQVPAEIEATLRAGAPLQMPSYPRPAPHARIGPTVLTPTPWLAPRPHTDNTRRPLCGWQHTADHLALRRAGGGVPDEHPARPGLPAHPGRARLPLRAQEACPRAGGGL